MNRQLMYAIPAGLPIVPCPRCKQRVAVVRVENQQAENVVLVEYPPDGRIIGKMFPKHECKP